MTDRWQVVTSPVGRARRVPFGPAGDTLPSRFTAQVDYTTRPLRVTIRASFNGAERVKVESVTVKRTDGESVTPEDMTMLQLGQVVWTAVRDAVDHGSEPISRLPAGRQAGGPTDDELLRLARIYWLAYVSWGKPRQDIRLAFGRAIDAPMPRSTSNQWIRKARERHELPGPHADEED
jgi:hypothetical protein